MAERSISVRQLIDVLPDLAEFDALRQTLRRAAVEDSAEQWTGRASYSTVDRRVISLSSLASLTGEAEAEVRGRIKRLYEAANVAFGALTGGRADEKVRQLVALGESAEATEHFRDAAAYYLLANGVVRTVADLALHALVQRRVARTALNIGDFARATHFYSRSLATAATAGDVAAEITATTGLGNVCTYQGRWADAETWYEKAVRLCGDAFVRERAQLLINRSTAARERNQFAEARSFLEQAADKWKQLLPLDRGGWYNNMGLLLLAEKEVADAEACFEKALEVDTGHFQRAMILDNLSEVALLRGATDQAEARCREAEQHAVEHGSPRGLGEVYNQLGKIAARRDDANGVAFFEKALETTRDRQYPLLVGEICYQYGMFRARMGEADHARALFTDALQLFAELGATNELKQVELELAKLAPGTPQPPGR